MTRALLVGTLGALLLTATASARGTAGQVVVPRGGSVQVAVVLDKSGSVRYRGRIDNFYADLGKPRRAATTHDLRDALDAVVAGRAVAHPETTPIGCFIVSHELFKEKK